MVELKRPTLVWVKVICLYIQQAWVLWTKWSACIYNKLEYFEQSDLPVYTTSLSTLDEVICLYIQQAWVLWTKWSACIYNKLEYFQQSDLSVYSKLEHFHQSDLSVYCKLHHFHQSDLSVYSKLQHFHQSDLSVHSKLQHFHQSDLSVYSKLQHFHQSDLSVYITSLSKGHYPGAPEHRWRNDTPWNMMMMKCCLMSSDVSWHIRDKLWVMPKHGSIILYVHGNQRLVRTDSSGRPPRLSHSSWTLPWNTVHKES